MSQLSRPIPEWQLRSIGIGLFGDAYKEAHRRLMLEILKRIAVAIAITNDGEKNYLLGIAPDLHFILSWPDTFALLEEYANHVQSLTGFEIIRKTTVPQGWTYFVYAPVGVIKIGRSMNPIQRIRAIQTQSPVECHIIGLTAISETTLHRRFAHLRLHGEWFMATPELFEFITANSISDDAALLMGFDFVSGRPVLGSGATI